MEVILLERVGKLGQMGEVVRVKNGFARNFLLPKGKALRATKDNRERFEGMKGRLDVHGHQLVPDAIRVIVVFHGPYANFRRGGTALVRKNNVH